MASVSTAPDANQALPALYFWNNGGLSVLIPKRRGKGYDASITAELRPGDAVVWKESANKKSTLKAEFIKEESPVSLIVRIFGQPKHRVIPRSAVRCVIQGRFLNPAHRTVGLDQL